MSFLDCPFYENPLGKQINGLVLTNPSGLQLDISIGSVKILQTGNTYSLDSVQSYVFSPHNKWKKKCFIGIISNETTTDVWIDEYIHNGKKRKGRPPSGYSLYLTLGWFELNPDVTNFDTTLIKRRIYLHDIGI